MRCSRQAEQELEVEEDNPMLSTDNTFKWEVPTKESFEKAIGMAIKIFSDTDWDNQEILDYLAMGWNTGVGMVAFRTNNMNLVEHCYPMLSHIPYLPIPIALKL